MCMPGLKLPGISGMPDPNRPLNFAQRVAKKAKRIAPRPPGGAPAPPAPPMPNGAPRPY